MIEKGPFEAAIEELKQSQYIQSGLWMEEHNPTEYDSAIRVLEAAGKMKDPRATKLAFLTIIDEARIDEENQFVCDIRALLEALPGKEKK